jgi:hypothetical protein
MPSFRLVVLNKIGLVAKLAQGVGQRAAVIFRDQNAVLREADTPQISPRLSGEDFGRSGAAIRCDDRPTERHGLDHRVWKAFVVGSGNIGLGSAHHGKRIACVARHVDAPHRASRFDLTLERGAAATFPQDDQLRRDIGLQICVDEHVHRLARLEPADRYDEAAWQIELGNLFRSDPDRLEIVRIDDR